VDTGYLRKYLSQNLSAMKQTTFQALTYSVVEVPPVLVLGDNRIPQMHLQEGIVPGDIVPGDIAPEDIVPEDIAPLGTVPLGIVPVAHLLKGMAAKLCQDLMEDLEVVKTAPPVDLGVGETPFLHELVEMELGGSAEGMSMVKALNMPEDCAPVHHRNMEGGSIDRLSYLDSGQ
jgi:hypothetical protein